MENTPTDCPTSIMQLPNDCLYFIFRRLDCASDRESFGLTCRRWLHIENSSRQSLQFQCSFGLLSISSPSQNFTRVTAYHLHRLLNRFQQLESLSLTGCAELPDSGLTQLQHFGSRLYALHLDCCLGITDEGLSLVACGCTSLTLISLYRCYITDAGLKTLAKSCLALRDVDLSYCQLISDHGVRALSQNCAQLRAVRISHCSNVNGTGFRGCSEALVYLEANSCKLEPEGTLSIVSGGGLEYLNVSCLSWCIQGNGLSALGAGFARRLRILDFRMCRTITDGTIAAISKGCPSLQEWNLALCHEVRIPGWESIGLNCHNLERLHVNRCRNLCDQGLEALRNGCKKLLILYVTPKGCRRISTLAIELFKCLRGDVEMKNEEIMCIAPDWAFVRK